MSDFKVIQTNILPDIKEIRLYPETIDHINEQHPEVPVHLPLMVDAIENTIVNPTHIESSHSNAYVFVDTGSTNGSGDPLRVPVKIVGDYSARVRTAYFASSNSTANVIWTRGDE